MHIILTHEQADFDAIASLLGAYLINKDAIPILPRRINRNIRAFLTIYGVEFPFIDQRELASDRIDKITLVDTQSMISIKGFGNYTHVHVVDHHPLREDLPPEWDISIANTGANTTLFVETLQQSTQTINSIQATLLLLGIYEDTGSLTYITTTPRDLYAASFLLEKGADLSVAVNFLNHPLSEEQQTIYNEMINNLQFFNIHGHSVIFAEANATGIDEELSTVVHKIRDQYDPDALFVSVLTKGGVQIIARSTSDDIDVSNIVAKFGGGGHDRAAAGLVKVNDLEKVRNKLISILPDHIQPAMRVKQIMSKSPKLISPDTSIDDAIDKMQRYGYEGFPVIESNKVIGLLTRRVIDRAKAHKLQLTAKQLMDAGDFSVLPNDSIETLQKVMIESGWGQIPVINPDTKEIVGIATRTDLIKTMKSSSSLSNHHNISDRLEKTLPNELLSLLCMVADIADTNSYALYIVGGFVRDLLLECPSKDFDLVVEGDAVVLGNELIKHYGGRVISHSRFGTAKWIIKDIKNNLLELIYQNKKHNGTKEYGISKADIPDSIDLVSARTEFYTHPTALPTVEKGSVKLDLHRRDFTINTLALRLDGRHYGELNDYWGGLSDLRKGLIRVLHSLSFIDDPTRILRAVRFEKRFGFKIEKRTKELMQQATSMLSRISGDRIRHELDNILVETKVIDMMDSLNELGILKLIHPDFVWDDWLKERTNRLRTAVGIDQWCFDGKKLTSLHVDITYVLLLLRQKWYVTQKIISRLKLSVGIIKAIKDAQALWEDVNRFNNYKISELVNYLEGKSLNAICAVYLAIDNQHTKDLLSEYVTNWRFIYPVTDGNELKRKGIPPGPIYRNILRNLRNARLDGIVRNDMEELTLLDKLLVQFGQSKDS